MADPMKRTTFNALAMLLVCAMSSCTAGIQREPKSSVTLRAADAERIARMDLKRRGLTLPPGAHAEVTAGNNITEFQTPTPVFEVIFWSTKHHTRKHLYTVTVDGRTQAITGFVDISQLLRER